MLELFSIRRCAMGWTCRVFIRDPSTWAWRVFVRDPLNYMLGLLVWQWPRIKAILWWAVQLAGKVVLCMVAVACWMCCWNVYPAVMHSALVLIAAAGLQTLALSWPVKGVLKIVVYLSALHCWVAVPAETQLALVALATAAESFCRTLQVDTDADANVLALADDGAEADDYAVVVHPLAGVGGPAVADEFFEYPSDTWRCARCQWQVLWWRPQVGDLESWQCTFCWSRDLEKVV